MLRLIQRWAIPCCLSSVCLWSLGCDGGSSTPPATTPPADSSTQPEGEATPSGEGEATPEATPPAGEAAAEGGGGSTISFGDL